MSLWTREWVTDFWYLIGRLKVAPRVLTVDWKSVVWMKVAKQNKERAGGRGGKEHKKKRAAAKGNEQSQEIRVLGWIIALPLSPVKITEDETEEVSQWLGAFSFLSGDFGLIPNTHLKRFTTACHSNSRNSNTLFWTLGAPALMCTRPCTHVWT